MNTADAIQAYVDSIDHAVSLATLIAVLPDHSAEGIKASTKRMYDARAINRVSVKSSHGPFFYVFYSLSLPTTTVHREAPALAPAITPALAEVPAGVLTPEQAVDVLERGGWVSGDQEEIVFERRTSTSDRRAARISVMDVIDRWKLGYRLSRVIEIVGGARNRKLTEDDVDIAVRMLREHAKDPT